MEAEQIEEPDVMHLVQSEYREMPGLRLTKPQLRRLCGLEEQTCDAVLEQLVSMHFLKRTSEDVYALDAPAY
jgi:hypothetical protein